MSDHIEIYNQLKRTQAERSREAESRGNQLQQLDRGFREVLKQWLARENRRIAEFGFAEYVELQLEEPGTARMGSAHPEWRSNLSTQPPGSHKLRYFISYRLRFQPSLPLTYLIIFSYAPPDLGGALQLIRYVEDQESKIGEMYPKIVGEGGDGDPAYVEELNNRLSEILNIAAADYREHVLHPGQPVPTESYVRPLGARDSGLLGKEPRG